MVNVNGNDMWKKIEQLGPQCKRAISIPMEVIINNKMMTDQKLVLQKWRDDFVGLYKGIPAGTPGHDESFLKQAKMTLRELDLKDLNNDNSFKSITQSEVLAMTQHIKMVRQYLWIRFLMKFSKMKHVLTFYVLSTMYVYRGVSYLTSGARL